MKVKYRVEVNHLSKEYDDWALEESSPHYTLESAIDEITRKYDLPCVDDKSKPVKIELYEYTDKGLVNIWTRREYRNQEVYSV